MSVPCLMRCRIAALVLVFAVYATGVDGAENPAPIRFTRHDPALGRPHVDRIGDVAFSGTIRVSGRLVVQREDPALCGGACAYFVPDRASQARLPREIRSGGAVPIASVQLYDAAPILVRLLGAREARRWLASGRGGLSLPVTLTLADYRIYGACDAVHQEARVVDAASEGPTLASADERVSSAC